VADLETRAEILKLARLLGVPPERLDYLGPAAAKDVRRVRELVTERVFDGDARRLTGLANASKRLPDALVATISQRVFGPLLCARVAGLLDVDQSVDLARRMPESFLADIGTEIDPRRISPVLERLPVEMVVACARDMTAKREYVAMGRFVGYLPDATLRACLEVIGEADLLRIGFVLEGRNSLDRVIALVSDERLEGFAAAAREAGLEDELLFALERLGAKQRKRLEAVLTDLASS
jgi:hypothetical protein